MLLFGQFAQRPAFGDRQAVLAREVTKLHEQILRGPLSQIRSQLEPGRIKGEITLLVAGSDKG